MAFDGKELGCTLQLPPQLEAHAQACTCPEKTALTPAAMSLGSYALRIVCPSFVCFVLLLYQGLQAMEFTPDVSFRQRQTTSGTPSITPRLFTHA